MCYQKQGFSESLEAESEEALSIDISIPRVLQPVQVCVSFVDSNCLMLFYPARTLQPVMPDRIIRMGCVLSNVT